MAQGTKRTLQEITPSPKAKGVRKEFDATSLRKKRKTGTEQEEETFEYFGPAPPKQPATTALHVFSYLSNADLYKAALVSKSWHGLAMNEELWKFD